MKRYLYPKRADWKNLCSRPAMDQQALEDIVQTIISNVKQNGDNALKELTQEFDHWAPKDLRVSQQEINGAANEIPEELKKAILLAKENIEKFHRSQMIAELRVETSPGILCWRKSVAIEKVGLYIPGGNASLFSTLLMLAVPATLAGCEEIVVCTPAKEGVVNPAILYVAKILGLNKIFKVGGAQAIAAMAFGTKSISAVYKIFGPGNQYVTRAKQLVNHAGISIDMPAGPSELAIFADETSVPRFVAADLLSQAEHGTDSQVILVATHDEIIDKVMEELEIQKLFLPRRKIIHKSLENSLAIVLGSSDAFDFLNEYAPEHLIIASTDATGYADKVKNAGSIFLGNFSPESAGDYISGTNHTLPTSGFAKAFSGVSIDSFVKKITFQQLSMEGLQNVSSSIQVMAAEEGLDAHKNAVKIRFENK